MKNLTVKHKQLSKSLQQKDFPQRTASEDSGFESDISSCTSFMTINSTESISCLQKDPEKLLLGPGYSLVERMNGVNNALNWLKHELEVMRNQDKNLMKQIISNRAKIAKYKQYIEGKNEQSEQCTFMLLESAAEKETRKRLNSYETFPDDGSCFHNNKRATWCI